MTKQNINVDNKRELVSLHSRADRLCFREIISYFT